MIFGSEPTDAELYAFILETYPLIQHSKPHKEAPIAAQPEQSFKRRQRESNRLLTASGITSKAHAALRLELGQRKQIRKEVSKAEQERRAEACFRLHQEHKKPKKRGR